MRAIILQNFQLQKGGKGSGENKGHPFRGNQYDDFSLSEEHITRQRVAYDEYYGAHGSQKGLKSYLKTDEGKKQIIAAQNYARSISNDGKTIELYRGIEGNNQYKQSSNKLVSWSANPDIAYQFASGEFSSKQKQFGAIYKIKIPIENIMFSPKTFEPLSDESIVGGMDEFIIFENNCVIELDENIENW